MIRCSVLCFFHFGFVDPRVWQRFPFKNEGILPSRFITDSTFIHQVPASLKFEEPSKYTGIEKKDLSGVFRPTCILILITLIYKLMTSI